MSMTDEYLKLSGANKFLAEHCKNVLLEQAKLLRGISHSVNRCNAEYADCWEAVKELKALVANLDASDSNAAIGQLQQQVAALEDSMEKARAAYAKLKNGKHA